MTLCTPVLSCRLTGSFLSLLLSPLPAKRRNNNASPLCFCTFHTNWRCKIPALNGLCKSGWNQWASSSWGPLMSVNVCKNVTVVEIFHSGTKRWMVQWCRPQSDADSLDKMSIIIRLVLCITLYFKISIEGEKIECQCNSNRNVADVLIKMWQLWWSERTANLLHILTWDRLLLL